MSIFRMEFMSYGYFQLDIKLLQYIFTSMYQINRHQKTQNLTYFIQNYIYCRPYGKDSRESISQAVAEDGNNPQVTLWSGIETNP